MASMNKCGRGGGDRFYGDLKRSKVGIHINILFKKHTEETEKAGDEYLCIHGKRLVRDRDTKLE